MVCMGGVVVRRKRRDSADMPAEFIVFDPAGWPGGSEYQRWVAWDKARRAWACKNLPNGEDDLPCALGAYVPDQPWDEVVW